MTWTEPLRWTADPRVRMMSGSEMHTPTQRPFTVLWPCLSLICAALAACGASRASGPASPSVDVDLAALEQRAGSVIVAALAEAATERAALNELRMAAAAGVPWARLALEPGPRRHPSPDTRTELLALLAERGDEHAITALQQATARDTTTLAARLSLIDEDAFSAELPEALRHTAERVRDAALKRLRDPAPITPQVALEVEALARRDPSAAVRASAIDVLVAHRRMSFEGLQTLLSDRDGSVRALVMRALARLDCSRTHALLADRLSGAPSHDALAAVRALLPCGTPVLAPTLDALRRALLVADNALRAEAAVTADSFAWRQVPQWLSDVLADDPTPSVVLAIAIALRHTQPDMTRAALRKLAHGQHPVVSVQAASVLAELDDHDALAILRAARTHADAATRRTAFRALARHGHAGDLEPGLRDADVSVRLAAAGAVLRATL